MENTNIYTDKVRAVTITIVQIFFMGLLLTLLISRNLSFLINLVIAILLLLFAYAAFTEIKKVFNPKLLYSIDAEGISDHTIIGSSVTIEWQKVLRAELISDISNYQIAIVGEDDNNDYTYILISRYSFTWRKFKNIWKYIEFYSKEYDFEIVNNTPFSKYHSIFLKID